MKRWIAGIIIFLLAITLKFVFGQVTNDSCRIAVGIYQGTVPDQSLTDLLTVSLANQPGIEALERANMDRILAEWQRAGLAGDLARQVQIGHAAGVDYFIWVTLDANCRDGILEIVSAATGRSVASQRIDTTPASLSREIPEQVCRYIGNQSDSIFENGIVLSRPTVVPVNSNNLAVADRLLEDLADALIKNQLPLLHRRYVVDLVTERWWSEKGILALPTHRQILKGARFILSSKLSFEQTPPQLTLALVDSTTGARIATQDFTLTERGAVLVLPDNVTTWVSTEIGWKAGEPEKDKSERLQPETLNAFYKGILLYNERRFLDALDFFTFAHAMEPSFAQSVDWIRECFAAAGFNEVVKSLDDYRKEVSGHRVLNVPFYINNWKHLATSPGVSLLGLTCRKTALQSQNANFLLQRLALALEKQGNVFIPDDIATLAKEYDAFVGLESVDGAHWKTAPLLLFKDMISAHLYRTNKKLVLELVHVHELDPKSCRRVSMQLDDNPAKWDVSLSRAVKRIFEESSERVVTSGITPLTIEKSVEELKEELQREYKDSTYLKLLYKDPAHSFLDARFPRYRPYVSSWDSMGWGRYATMGLSKYIIRSGSGVNYEKVWQEMAILTSLNPTGYGSANPEGVRRLTMPELMIRMRNIAERYPSHPAGLAARYNILLWDLHASNYRQSWEELADILSQIESKYREIYQGLALTVMRSTFAALSLALGEPFNPPPEGCDFRGILLAENLGTFDNKPTTWSLFPPPNQMHEWYKLSPDAARQAVPIFLYLVPEMVGDPSRTRPCLDRARFILDCAPTLPLARDMVANAIWDCMRGDIDDGEHAEFNALCEDYAQVLVGYFNEPCPKPGPFRPRMWIDPFFGNYFYHRGLSLCRMYWLPESSQEQLRHAARELESAILKAVAEKRITDNSLIDYLTKAGLLKHQDEDEQTLLAQAEKEWKRFHYAGRAWFDYMKWKKPRASPAEWINLCRAAYERLRATQIQWPKNSNTMRVYAYLGIEFFRAGENDLAEQINSEIISWQDVKVGKHDFDLRPQAHWMLVLIAHRQGDLPKAFRLAQQGLDVLGERNGKFWLGISGAGAGGEGNGVLQLLRNFIAQARANPNLPYEDPFIAFEKQQYDLTYPCPGATSGSTFLSTEERPAKGRSWEVPGLGATLVWLEPGVFNMGGTWRDSKPVTRVILSQGFWIGQHEVRLQDWLQVMDYNPNRIQDDLSLPVERVSWFDAMDFCRRLTAREKSAGRLPDGYVYRLPTEAEWEYASRAGLTASRSSGITGKNIGDYAWYSGNSDNRIHPVGSKRPNAWGLFDMLGNVSEWCFDRYGRYPGGEVVDPRGPSRRDKTIPSNFDGSTRVTRGGDAETGARYLDCVLRACCNPSFGADLAKFRGFRMVLAPDLLDDGHDK